MEQRREAIGLLVAGAGGTALGVALATILAAKPAEAAPADEKLNYLIDLLTALIPVLAEVAEGQATLNQSFQQWLALQGIEPGVEVSVSTPWVAQEPVEIFAREVREAAVTIDCDKMLDYRRGKRLLFKVESSLDQAVNFQLVGNIVDDMGLATNINAALAVAANGNISVGLAWDDWHPFVGARVIVGAAPTTGRLKVEYSIQE